MEYISIYTISLGCPKNLVDTEKMLTQLHGYYQPADSLQEADFVLINTCAFISPAVEESIATILDVAQDLQEMSVRPLLLVTGCLLTRYQEELITEIPEVDLWIPFKEQTNWLQIVAQKLTSPGNSSKLLKIIEPLSRSVGEDCQLLSRVISTAPSYAYLKISEGCSHNCRFCLIPQ